MNGAEEDAGRVSGESLTPSVASKRQVFTAIKSNMHSFPFKRPRYSDSYLVRKSHLPGMQHLTAFFVGKYYLYFYNPFSLPLSISYSLIFPEEQDSGMV